MTKNYSALHESMQTRTLANGLRICYLPKEGFSKTFAILATDFGSVDASFTFEGKRYDTPAGVAHFLEHKMFEDEDGNALQKFARTGASPNAFTSHTMTAYHFSCTDRFEENLKILLKFVFTPYFTDDPAAHRHRAEHSTCRCRRGACGHEPCRLRSRWSGQASLRYSQIRESAPHRSFPCSSRLH